MWKLDEKGMRVLNERGEERYRTIYNGEGYTIEGVQDGNLCRDVEFCDSKSEVLACLAHLTAKLNKSKTAPLQKIGEDYWVPSVACCVIVTECSYKLRDTYFTVELKSGDNTVELKTFTGRTQARAFAEELVHLLNREA